MQTPDLHGRPSIPLVIAHRGARGHVPENTLASATLGYQMGADLLELDVNYTKDGQLVVIHDDNLLRTTNAATVFPGRPDYRVCDFTFDEIRQLDAGSWFAERDPYGTVADGEVSADSLASFTGLQVPTLEEELNFVRGKNWFVNVEIKDHQHLVGHTTVTGDVLQQIRKLDMVEQVIISSFQPQYLLECHDLCPEIATGALLETPRPEDPVAFCRELGVNAYHPERKIVTAEDLAALRDAGLAVNIWTVNDMEEAQTLIAQGASGIITDFAGRCRQTFDA